MTSAKTGRRGPGHGAGRQRADGRGGAQRQGLEALDGLVRQMAASRASLERARDYASAQRELVEAYRQFSELYDFLPIAYLLVDHRGIVRRVNRSGEALFGLPRPAIVGRPLVAFFGRDSVREIAAAVLRPGTLDFEARLLTVESARRVRLVWRATRRDDQKPEFHLAVVDVTETRQLREETRRAREERDRSEQAEREAREASEAKDQFLATLSHELRTPLTPILSAVDALDGTSSAPGVQAAVDVIRRNVRAEARLIDDLLDVARITQKKLVLRRQAVDLHEIVGNVVEDWRPAAAAAGVELALRLDARHHHVSGDAARLAQVCRNLLNNALKFSETGGRITVASSEAEGRVSLSVADTGIGMTAEQAERIFEPFVQFSADAGRRGGLGLGLVISRGIVEAHDGSIHAVSQGPGHGTTVVLELPAVAPAPAAERAGRAAGPTVQPEPPHPVRRLLLVEDHADSAEMLSLLLRSEGYEVELARSKREALARLDDCDLVVSDIGLPDGSGLELMAEARRRRPVRGIALSGYGSEQDVERSLAAGFTAHLTKPVDFDRLLSALRHLA